MKIKTILMFLLLLSFLVFVSIPASSTINFDSINIDNNYDVQGDISNVALNISKMELDMHNIKSTNKNVTVEISINNENTNNELLQTYSYETTKNGIITDELLINLVGPNKFNTSDFPESSKEKLQLNISINHKDINKKSMTKTINITNLGYAETCSNLISYDSSKDSGYYNITFNDNETEVYCSFNNTLLNTSETYTFKYIQNGEVTYGISDSNTCQEYGLQLFVPRSQNEYNISVDYVSNIYGHPPSDWTTYRNGGGSNNGGLGPMGLYYNELFEGNSAQLGDSQFETKNLHSSHYGTNSIDEPEYDNDEGWRTFLDTDKFWLSSGTVDSEPNGDYVPNTWLGFSWDKNGDITDFNDQSNKYGYSSYLCTQQY